MCLRKEHGWKLKGMVVLALKLLEDKCVWIYEGFPVSGVLNYPWLQNSIRHDFGFVRWKYLSVNVDARAKAVKSFRPLSLMELAGKEREKR